MARRADDDALTQRKEYDQVVNERDVLGTQLIRRNDELALLYEKLRVQMSTLRVGESQYNLRLQDMRVLRIKVTALSLPFTFAFRTSCVSFRLSSASPLSACVRCAS